MLPLTNRPNAQFVAFLLLACATLTLGVLIGYRIVPAAIPLYDLLSWVIGGVIGFFLAMAAGLILVLASYAFSRRIVHRVFRVSAFRLKALVIRPALPKNIIPFPVDIAVVAEGYRHQD